MSSRRKIQARRKGQRQEAAARARGLIHVRVPEIHERTASRFPTYALEVARDGSGFAFIGVPAEEHVNYTAELVPLALFQPNLSVNGLREVLGAARDVDPTLTKVYLSHRDVVFLANSVQSGLVYSDEMQQAVSRALGITVRGSRYVSWGGAVLEFKDGRTESLAPHASQEKS